MWEWLSTYTCKYTGSKTLLSCNRREKQGSHTLKRELGSGQDAMCHTCPVIQFFCFCNASNSFPAQPAPCQFACVLHALGNLDAQSSAAGLHEGFAFCWWCHIHCSLYTWKSVLGLLIKCCCPVLQTNSIHCVKNCYDSGDFLHQRYMLLNFGFSHLSLGRGSNYSSPQHHQFEKKRQNIV